MSAKNAPLIKRYSYGNAPEGYNFVVVVNEEAEAKYVEKVQYKVLDGLELLGAYAGGKSYEMTVEPGEAKCVVLRASFEGFGISAATSQVVFHGTTILRELCLQANQKEQI